MDTEILKSKVLTNIILTITPQKVTIATFLVGPDMLDFLSLHLFNSSQLKYVLLKKKMKFRN